MKKQFFNIIILNIALFACMHSYAQQNSFPLLKTIEANIADFSVDNFGNIFLVTATNQLKKLNSNGDSLAVFNDVKKYGTLYSIDATNPLKVLLYYRNFATIVVLDRMLNVRNTIDLRQQNIFRVKAISQSFDNNVWVFDEQDAKLKKIGEDGKLMQETVDFRLLFDSIPQPIQVMDQNGYVYLNDPQKGIYVFDIYGAYKNKINITGLHYMQVIGNMLYGLTQNQFIAFDTKTFIQKNIELPASFYKAKKIKIIPQAIFVLDTNLKIYSLN